ncbi:doubled motif LPXTG anchor domain-containing protein [Clostridium sp. E02]|uniref:doubled motif LPXTG anchor domain-containing protein n=1 Tax=Clostridium sp. E02 TaxID=2487134 RepID=UPI000F51C3FA|nr:doubled motif LPXTG anchor domain-containing protein [Clostridium sp. E02]
MRALRKKVHAIKRLISWLLTVAIVMGNVSQVMTTTVYAADKNEYRKATLSNGEKATPSEATPSQARQVIGVKVTQSQIEKVLKKDPEQRPELKEDLIPFKGEHKNLVLDKLYQELEDKTLITQKKVGKAMYLVLVSDNLEGEPFFDKGQSDRIRTESFLHRIQVIGINGYKDRECEFKLKIQGEDLFIADAQVDEYKVVGKITPFEEQKTESKSAEEKSQPVKETEAELDAETKKNPETDVNIETKENPETDSTAETKENPETDSTAETKENPETDSTAETDKKPEVTISKQDAPILFQNIYHISTPTQAEPDRDAYEEADVIPVDSRSLTKEERSDLMGSPLSFSMVVSNYGIVTLDSEVSEEETITPYDTALLYYGPDATEKKEIVEISLNQSQTGKIKAGTVFSYVLTYTMQASPLYEYAAGGKLSLFDHYEHAKIVFKVPAGIVLEEKEGKVTQISSTDGETIYEIHVGDEAGTIRPGKSDRIILNAHIDGNGSRGIGESFALPDNSVEFHAEVKVADKSDTDQIEYPGNIETKTYASQPETSTLMLTSDDAWHIRKQIEPTKNSYEVIKDNKGTPKFIEIKYLIEVGMYGESGQISRQPGGTIYQTYGRTVFTDQTFRITDSLSILTPGAPEGMKPVSIKAAWGDKSPVSVTENEDGSIAISQFKTKGQEKEGHIHVSDSAPTYSSYRVTARYPYDPFLLLYNDERVGDSSVFTIQNTARLEYQLLGTNELLSEESKADIAIHEVNQPAIITIQKVIDEGIGSSKPYDTSMENEYPGFSRFEIYTVDDKNHETPYKNYTVIDRKGNQIESKDILVNPSMEKGEEGLYVTGDDGSIRIQIDPGTFVIKEVQMPVGTSPKEDSIPVAVKAGENKRITVVNNVIGKGAIAFYKKARTFDTANTKEEELKALEGAEFTLYEQVGDALKKVRTAKSDERGFVLFKPLTPGSYIVRETSANGYILDPNKYNVIVRKGETSPLMEGNQALVNIQNGAKIQVTKLLLNDQGDYKEVPDLYRSDFNNHFWLEESLDGMTWNKVKKNNNGFYSLNQESEFDETLPVYKDGVKINYRVVEQLPEGYQAPSQPGTFIEVRAGISHVVQNFDLTPVNTTKIVLKNDRGGNLTLKKEVWSFGNQWSQGWINKNNQRNGYAFRLYETEKGTRNFTEVTKDHLYYTDANGFISINDLDISKSYYFMEIGSEFRLETDDPLKIIDLEDNQDGITHLIGPFSVSREKNTFVSAYNIPQKVPYWIHKRDITDKNRSISAILKITNTKTKEVMYEGKVTNDGTFLTLDVDSTYEVEEVTPTPFYEKMDAFSFTTPKGPITKKRLEQWFGHPDDAITTHVSVYNKPFKDVKVTKTQISSDGKKNDSVARKFEVYTKEEDAFHTVTLPNGNQFILSNEDTKMAPGMYYFKEVVPEDVINPLYLLPNRADGIYQDYEIKDAQVYYGPASITAANEAEETKMTVELGEGEKALANYVNQGRVIVRKRDALRKTPVKGAALGIFYESQFQSSDWESSISHPIETGITDGNGQVVFEGNKLKIFDENGERISYVIAEIAPPSAYLQSYETVTTKLLEGTSISTVNGDINGAVLRIEDEPKLTIRTKKYWRDSWNDQFYKVNRPLGGVKLALYKVNKEDPNRADLVALELTNAYDGAVTFTDINRTDTYYVAEVRVPTKEESGLPFELNMGEKQPLPLNHGEPVKTLLVSDLKQVYHTVSYSGKELETNPETLVRETEPLYNETSWVQFNIWKICDGIDSSGKTHDIEPINGARFTLYMSRSEESNLSKIELEDLADESRFLEVGHYESGTRLDPATGKRLDGQFDTSILEGGRLYWLVEDEAAPGYTLPKGRNIQAVFVPEGGSYHGMEEIVHTYKSGRNEKIAIIKNQHAPDGSGLFHYHFQIALNKWLNHIDETIEPTLLGGVKFKIWLLHPETKEKLFPVDVVETGLESDNTHKTGYALSKIIRMDELSKQLEEQHLDPKEILFFEKEGEPVKALFGLEEIETPSKVVLNPTLHILSVAIPYKTDEVDRQYFWDEKKTDESYRLLNNISKEYPVTLIKYGYVPDSSAFYKTDDQLANMNLNKTPLSSVTLDIWQYQWTENGYQYVHYGTYHTDEKGQVNIKNGLPSGRYRLKETLTSKQKETYLTMYTGKGSLWRYFTVKSQPMTVPVFNPEKPVLNVEKTLWNGTIPTDMDGVTIVVTDPKGNVLTKEAVKGNDGRYWAEFQGLESGRYVIKSEILKNLAKERMASNYFEEKTVMVGYKPHGEKEEVTLVPVDGSVLGNVVDQKVKNPLRSDLIVKKTDANTGQSDALLKGAIFHLEYLKFQTGSDLIDGQLKDVTKPEYKKPEHGFVPIKQSMVDLKNGSYVLKDCEPGWYRVVEERAPDGYTVDSTPVVIAVTGDMDGSFKHSEVTFKNRKKVVLTVTKKLYFGDGFIKDPDIKEKLPKEIVFDIYTYSEDEKVYKPVYDEETHPLVVKITTLQSEDGYEMGSAQVLLPQNPKGSAYYLKERGNKDWMYTDQQPVENGILYPDGYMLVGTSEAFTTDNPVAITVKNQYAKSKIRLIKVDAVHSNQKLSGASFQLFKDKNLTEYVGDFKEIEKSGVYEAVFSKEEYNPNTYYIKEVNAPPGYLVIDGAFPEQGVIPEVGKTTELTVENQGGIDFVIQKYSGIGKNETKKAGITFELYRKVENGTWDYVTEETTDVQGNLSFRGLKQQDGYAYGLYEVPVTEHGFDLFSMEAFRGELGNVSPLHADVSKNGEVRNGVDLYVLSNGETKAPGVYRFEAHNQEALPLKLIKNDWNKQENPDGSIKVVLKVTDQETQKQVGDLVEVPYGDEGTTIKLLPGTYEIEETSISPNQQGFILNKDDTRTLYQKQVTIEKGKLPVPCEFTNVKQNTGVSIDKTTQTHTIQNLWWKDSQTVTYTITPKAVNTIPIDEYMVEDQGILMLDASKNVLEEPEYTYNHSSIASVTLGKASQKNHIRDASTGTITGEICFYDFDGNQVGSTQRIEVSGEGEIQPVVPEGETKIKSFTVSYQDDTLKQSTKNEYTLGQDFVPGNIKVTAKVFRQNAKLEDGRYKKEIKYIRNQTSVTMKDRRWDINGALLPEKIESQAEAICDIEIVPSQAPVLSVSKNVNPIKGIQPGDTLTYYLTVTNATKSNDKEIVPIQKPILIDLVPLGVTVSGETGGENHLLKAVSIEKAPAGVHLRKTIRKVDPVTGRETLFLQLDGALEKGESVTVSVSAQIAGNIINYGKNILNTLFVTSDVLQPAFSLNQTGASFQIETSTGNKWPSEDLPKAVTLSDEKYRSYGYASDSAENTMSTGTGIHLFKEVKGNLDTRFVSGTTVGKVAKSADDTDLNYQDGTVLYRLTVHNSSDVDYVSQLSLMDILPVKGDRSTGGFERLSDYRLKFEGIESIQIENRTKESPSDRKTEDFTYDLTYSNEKFQDEAVVAAGKEALLYDNRNGFWSTNSRNPSAFHVKIRDDKFYLAPGENLVVTYRAVVPYNTAKELEEAAYGYAVNDFATVYSTREGGLLGTEKEYSQIQTSDSVQVVLVPGKVKVSGRIWIDEDDNGIQNENVTQDHLLTDLSPLLSSGYFQVSLSAYSKYGDDVSFKQPGVTDARFLFENLMPAKPVGINGTDFTQKEEDLWYHNQTLRVGKLKGVDPAHYQMYVNQGTMPDEFKDLILKLGKPNMGFNGPNRKAGRSRLPRTLIQGGQNYEESWDSNFTETRDGYASEDFFLWASANDYDKTKDIGFVPYRKVIVKKTNQEKNPVVGAHFTIYGPYTNTEMEELEKKKITDEKMLSKPAAEGITSIVDGEAIWNAGELLYYRNYVIVEDQAPDGYRISGASSKEMEPLHSFQVKGQNAWILKSKEFKTQEDPISGTVTVTNSFVTGSLEFTKIDLQTEEEIGGARFRITKKRVPVLDAFQAWTKELKKNPDAMGILNVETTKDDVTFTVATGKVFLTGIPQGSYTMSEIQVPNGYDITKKRKEVEFQIQDQDQKAVLVGLPGNRITNTKTEYQIQIRKEDETGNQKVKGIRFGIKKLALFKQYEYEEKETNKDGILTWNLPYGSYEITELPSPDYETIKPFRIKIDETGLVSLLGGEDRKEIRQNSKEQNKINFIVTNRVKTAPLYMEKLDGETKTPISGARFVLSGTSKIPGAFNEYLSHVTGLGVSHVTVNQDQSNPYVTFQLDGERPGKQGYLSGIPYGTYTLKEIQTPDGYVEGGFNKEFKLMDPKGIHLTGNEGIVNWPHELTIEKRDQGTKNLLSGAVFAFMTKSGRYVSFDQESSYLGLSDQEEANTHFVTGSEGKITLKRIPAGNYVLKEIQAPEHYDLSSDQEITVLRAGNPEAIVVYDTRKQGKIRIKKRNNLNQTIGGVHFTILGPGRFKENQLLSLFGASQFYKEAGGLSGAFVTEEDGTVTMELKHGDYLIREENKEGYHAIDPFYIRVEADGKVVILKDDSHAVMVSNNDMVTLTVTNQIKTGSLELEKVDQENKDHRLNGAEFKLLNISTIVPGAWEHYRDMAAAEGASWSKDQVKGNTISFLLEGKGKITNLPYGTYRLTETKAPDGYLLGKEPWSREFTLTESSPDAQFVKSSFLKKTNGPIENTPSRLKIVKTNAVYADRKLQGAEFILKDSNNQYVKLYQGTFVGYTKERGEASKFQTGRDGTYVIKKIPKGTYYFEETKAPNGYRINRKIPALTLDGVNGYTITIQDFKADRGDGGGDGGRDPSPSNPMVTIIPDPVPLSNLPQDNTMDFITIDDQEVPLGRLPKTGDHTKNTGKVFVVLSAFLMALYGALNIKKRKRR